MNVIFKIAHAEEWRAAERAGHYAGSEKDRADGFIHFSTAAQLAETLRRYYANASNLVLIAVDESVIGDRLKWEHAPSRGEKFPHLYAPLPLSAVKWTAAIARDSLGTAIVPPMAFAPD
jgi:uncharacterized protein (DUF952 family)